MGNRRDFLRRCLCATAASGAFGAMLGKLSLAQAAAPRLAGADYRALVCVYLYGGNDGFNMLVPRDAAHHAIYAATRGGLALPRAQLVALNPTVAPGDGAQYGLHPRMGALRDLFEAGDAAIVANVGPLLYPITRPQYESGSVATPPQLFSHSDQQLIWQTPTAEGGSRTGWGGRLADLFAATNPNQTLSMNVSLDGENVYQAGLQVSPYFMGVDGAETLDHLDGDWNARRRASFDAIHAQTYANRLERAYLGKVRRARDVSAMVDGAVDAFPVEGAPFDRFAQAWASLPQPREMPWVARQLRMVARLLAARNVLQMQRQIFFVGMGGYDTHATQMTDHAELMEDLALALKTFHEVTAALGLAEAVTTFTASEFGRTLSSNGDGTDHGWGSHHVVVGGAVQGRRIYGTLPSLAATNNPDDAGWGQIIPTTAVDQYAATIAKWYGLPDSDRATLFPNLSRFASPDLGFMQPS